MKLVFVFLLVVLFQVERAMAEEFITCQISGDTATAYYCNNSGGGSASGKVDIVVYDQHGAEVNSDWCIGIVVAINSCEVLCSVSAPSDSFFCGAQLAN